jgi:hypothetical protein
MREKPHSQPAISKALEIDIVNYRIGWFILRITVEDRSVLIYNDISTARNALYDLGDIPNVIDKGTGETSEVEFDDEGFTTRLTVFDYANGQCRLVMDDWCAPDGPIWLDVLLSTERFCTEITRSVATFRATDKTEEWYWSRH